MNSARIGGLAQPASITRAISLLASALLTVAGVVSCAGTEDTAASPARAPSGDADVAAESGAPIERDVDERADELLRAMGATLASARQMSFRVSVVEDVLDEDTGRTMQFLSRRSIELARPDRLRVEESDSFARHQAWFANGRVTFFDSATNRYAVADVPPTIDAMLDHLYSEYDLVMPIADITFSDPYDALSAGIETGVYLGEATIAGRTCHHLAFRQENIDWQIWINEAGGHTLPLQLVITYKHEAGSPQFAAQFMNWDLDASFPSAHFRAAVPAGAEQVSVETLTGDVKTQRSTAGGSS